MTTKEIQERLDEITALQGDNEAQHDREDALYRNFIEYIAWAYIGSLSDKAKLVLKTREMDFQRWYA